MGRLYAVTWDARAGWAWGSLLPSALPVAAFKLADSLSCRRSCAHQFETRARAPCDLVGEDLRVAAGAVLVREAQAVRPVTDTATPRIVLTDTLIPIAGAAPLAIIHAIADQ